MTGPTAVAAGVRAAVAAVLDPELPVLTIEDLGILRDVRPGPGGAVEVDITPTYSGCPAVAVIVADVERAARAAGAPEVHVRTVLAPAWTTDWMSAAGRTKLTAYGIAPPAPVAPTGPVLVPLAVRCPQCGSLDTRELSRFGSTACKALWRCERCTEPFDAFKPL